MSNRASISAIISLPSRRVPGFFDLTIGNWIRRVRGPACEERRTVRRPSATKSLTLRPRIAAAAFTCRYNSSSISIVAFIQTS